MTRTRPTLIAAGLLAATVLAACGSSDTPLEGARIVNVKLTDAGCEPASFTLPAGPTTFAVTGGSSAVTEAELLQGSKILGEKENLTAGLSGSFSLRLKAGKYTMSCPNGTVTAKAPVTVRGTATAASGDRRQLDAATRGYATYVKAQVRDLVARTQRFSAAVEAGDVAAAKRLYGPARVPYERIEPVAESFGNLDPAIDARINDVKNVKTWTGFHRIERALYVDDTAKGMAPYARKLLADTKRLRGKVATATYQPAQLANGAQELLNEVAKSKITGEEERYSHIDLLDFKANLDGAQVAFDLLRPALAGRDAALATTLQKRFTEVDDSLGRYRSGDGYETYSRLTKADTRALSQAVDALAEPLSHVASTVVVS